MATRFKKSVALTRSIEGLIGEIDAFDMITFDMIAVELRILWSEGVDDFCECCCYLLRCVICDWHEEISDGIASACSTSAFNRQLSPKDM